MSKLTRDGGAAFPMYWRSYARSVIRQDDETSGAWIVRNGEKCEQRACEISTGRLEAMGWEPITEQAMIEARGK